MLTALNPEKAGEYAERAYSRRAKAIARRFDDSERWELGIVWFDAWDEAARYWSQIHLRNIRKNTP